jgi:hypothetical protein
MIRPKPTIANNPAEELCELPLAFRLGMRPVILLDWTGLDFEVGSSPVQCKGLGAPGAPMQIQFSKWIRSIPHFAKRVTARFTGGLILVQCCGTYVFGINYAGYRKPS